MSERKSDDLVWMDLEMTGLIPETDVIIEIATLITNRDLDIIAEGPNLIIHQPPEMFQKMDDWNRKQHTKSGLWAKVLASSTSVTVAEEETLDFLRKHIPVNEVPLCGNSVWQDRRFLYRYMPKISNYLHYRIIDVSTVKELASRWYPKEFKKFKKPDDAHRALDDIKQSIEELKFYRKMFFRSLKI